MFSISNFSTSKLLVRASAALFAAGLFASPALAQAPDLVALSIQGPGQSQLGASASVNTFIVNLGGPLVGDIEFDILLSQDLTIDESDTVVLEHSTAFVGALNVPVTIPDTLSPGTYNWGIRVKPQATEVTTFNNEVLGGQVDLFLLDLVLDTNAPIAVSTVQGGADPSDITLQATNAGSGGAILIFNASMEPSVPWVSVTPTTSFVVAGGLAQPVVISFNTSGLPVGEHVTALRIASFADPTDFELIPITLTIGEAHFDIGDTLIGEILDPADDDVALFEMVAGEKLQVKFTTSFGNIKPTVEIISEDTGLVDTWNFKNKAQNSKQTFKAKSSGLYRLRIIGRDGTLGAYVVKTARKLPKKALEQRLKVKAGGTGLVQVAVRALSGATLDFTAEPKGGSSTLAVQIADPNGGTLDISGLVQQTSSGGLDAAGVPMNDVGEYLMTITGVGNGKKVKLVITPTQPDAGTTTVLVP